MSGAPSFTQRKGRRRPSGPSADDLGLHGGGPGKGDSPRSCLSKEFRNNYDEINWGSSERIKTRNFKKTLRRIIDESEADASK